MRSTSTTRSIPLFRSTSAAIFALLTLALCWGRLAFAADKDELQQLFIVEPYLELHEGPGRGYAVTQVVPRGESIDVLYRRTEWFRVRTHRGVMGWAYQGEMLKTQLADGSWYVRHRSVPLQPYFESDFPHGHDQWISAAATGWATKALAMTLP